MSDKLFDDLARTLAEPMPRRKAVRLFGVTLVAIAVPGVSARARASAAVRRDLQESRDPPQACIQASFKGPTGGQQCCSKNNEDGTKTYWKSCGYPWQRYRCAGPEGFTCVDTCLKDVQKGLPPGKTAKPTWSRAKAPDGGPKEYMCCMLPDQIARDGVCYPNCAFEGKQQCGTQCCDRGLECTDWRYSNNPQSKLRRTCLTKCRSIERKCGIAIGERCCPKDQACCGDDEFKVCCPLGRVCVKVPTEDSRFPKGYFKACGPMCQPGQKRCRLSCCKEITFETLPSGFKRCQCGPQ